MGSTGIKIQGMRELRAALIRFDSTLGGSQMQRVYEGAADVMARYGREEAPKRSGTLAGTIDARATPNAAIASAGAGIRYGAVIHFGWPGHNIAANTFMYRAVDRAQGEGLRALEDGINSLIRMAGL